MRRYWVYIVECADGTLYTGSTSDIDARVRMHNSGRGAKYTRGRGPVTVAYLEEAESLKGALRREREIKRLGRGGKLELCRTYDQSSR